MRKEVLRHRGRERTKFCQTAFPPERACRHLLVSIQFVPRWNAKLTRFLFLTLQLDPLFFSFSSFCPPSCHFLLFSFCCRSDISRRSWAVPSTNFSFLSAHHLSQEKKLMQAARLSDPLCISTLVSQHLCTQPYAASRLASSYSPSALRLIPGLGVWHWAVTHTAPPHPVLLGEALCRKRA